MKINTWDFTKWLIWVKDIVKVYYWIIEVFVKEVVSLPNTPIADTQVSEKYPTTNYWSSTLIRAAWVNAASNDQKHMLFKFDVPIWWQAASNVQFNFKAEIPWNIYSVPQNIAFYEITGSDWEENIVTWNTKPALTGVFAVVSITSWDLLPYNVNITNLYNKWVNWTIPNYWIGMALIYTQWDTHEIEVATKENVWNEPFLVVI